MFHNFIIFFYLILAGAIFYYFIFGRYKLNYPPGPTRLPILGNLLSVGEEMYKALAKYANIYGPIFSVKLANEEVVVLHGAKLIGEAFNDPNFSGRPDMEAARSFLSGGKNGIAFAEDSVWTQQRKFTLRNLRNFGFGKASLEISIMLEVKELIHWIKLQNGKPISLHRRLSLAILNTLWAILCGERYSHEDPQLVGILDQLEITAHAILAGKGKSLLIMFYPKIAKIFPNWSGWNFLVKSREPQKKLFEETIREHQRTLDDNHARDFIDAYLHKIKKTKDPNSVFHESSGVHSLESVLTDLFDAGSDTSSVTLEWAMLYLLRFPDIQTKLQKEIDAVVGKFKFPSLVDRNRMPYTEAFIMEVLRVSSIVSFGVPHVTTTDVQFHGYEIPKGTSIYGSFYSTHHDPEIWKDPKTFRPERFLNNDGSKVLKHDSLIPFSIGKRKCPGMLLARDQLFLFVTGLAQNFRILSEPGNPKTTTLDILAGKKILEPHPYMVVMEERF